MRAFRPLRTSASKRCWEFHGRSWLPLNKMAGTDSELLSHIKSRKLLYFGHIMRLPHDNIESSMMTGLVEGTRNRGRPRSCWIDNIVAWTDQSGANLLCIARDRGRWSALTHPRSQPSQSDDGEVTWQAQSLWCFDSVTLGDRKGIWPVKILHRHSSKVLLQETFGDAA